MAEPPKRKTKKRTSIYADYDVRRIAWGLKVLSRSRGVGAPALANSINDFIADKDDKKALTLDAKNVQRALKEQRQIDPTLRALDRYIAAARPLNAAARLGQALAEYFAPERMESDEGMFKGPAGFFAREFVGAYVCYHKRWLSPEERAAHEADPSCFHDQERGLRIPGKSAPAPDHEPFHFPVQTLSFRPTAGYGSIEVIEKASPYVDYERSPGFKPEPITSEGTLAATDKEGHYLGIVQGEGVIRIYRLNRGSIDEESGYHTYRGICVEDRRVSEIVLVPVPGEAPIGDYFPDELMSEPKKEDLFEPEEGDE